MNDSPNNTGLRELPPAQPALISYPASESKQFPIMGSGGRSAMAGPAYYKADFANAKRAFPEYYEGKVFFYEWMRDMILAVNVNEKGEQTNIERFLPTMSLSHPIDMAFGPNGDLYVLEYGTGWFVQNDDSRLVRIEYNAGNRKPLVQASASQTAGALPLKVRLSSEGTTDFDGDALTYQWKIYPKAGGQPTVLDGPNPSFTFQKAGQYKAVLTVKDDKGMSDSRDIAIVAGNQPPVVTLSITNGNKSFYFPGQPVAYQVNIVDKEDGSLSSGKITPKQVMVRSAYRQGGASTDGKADATPGVATPGHKFAETAYLGTGRTLIDGSDCKGCHFTDKKSIGPAFVEVSKRYKADPNAVASLSGKIIKGGGGVWGDAIMTAHPQLSPSDAQEMVKYILTLADKPAVAPALPPKGTVTPGKEQQGNLVLQASYKDKGANGLPAQTVEQTLLLRNPILTMGSSDSQSKGVMLYKIGQDPVAIVMASGTYVQFNKLDLTGIKAMLFAVAIPKQQLQAVGGRIEVRLDSPTGQLLGQTDDLLPAESKNAADVFKPSTTKITLTPATGIHDLYFVFRNEKAGKAPLFVPVTAQLFN
jgi:cytochrome c